MKKIYPGLYELRFIASLMIVVHHIEQFKAIYGINGLWGKPIVTALGEKGVTFFLVLSGFLITLSFFREKKENGKINLRNFYLKRFLRIAPIYYFVVFLSFFCLPSILNINHFKSFQDLLNQLLLFVIFAPNLALNFFPAVLGISQSWVIGVEEQTYLFLPTLIKKTSKFVFPILVTMLIFLKFLSIEVFAANTQFINIIKTFQFEKILIGGLGAYLFFYNLKNYINLIFNSFVQLFAFLLILVMSTGASIYLYYLPGYHLLAPVIESLAILVIILNISQNKKSILRINSEKLQMLGRFSYGIYLYHVIVILFVIKGIELAKITSGFVLNFSLYFLVIFITIFVSKISYNYIEKPILKLKNTIKKV